MRWNCFGLDPVSCQSAGDVRSLVRADWLDWLQGVYSLLWKYIVLKKRAGLKVRFALVHVFPVTMDRSLTLHPVDGGLTLMVRLLLDVTCALMASLETVGHIFKNTCVKLKRLKGIFTSLQHVTNKPQRQEDDGQQDQKGMQASSFESELH